VAAPEPDFDDPDDFDAGPRFPGTATAAGVIWLLYGGLGVLNGFLSFALAGAQLQQGGGGPPAGGAGGGCCPMLIGIAFLVCGLQTVRGTASDTRGNSIGSILLACLQLLVALAVIAFGAGAFGAGNQGNAGPNNPPETAVMVVIGLVVGAMGLGLFTAGVLGLMARKPYLEWRAYHHPKRRRVRRDDDWDDDRPRRRSREDDGD
jgi:hypothetical protein